MYSFEQLKPSYTEYLKSQIRPEWKHRIEVETSQVYAGRARYETVSARTKVPWYIIGIIHLLEGSGKWGTYLGNGESLSHVTTLVPRGRGPFKTWEEGAVDALKLHLKEIGNWNDWSDEGACYFFESYNGFGYHHHNVPSPYLASGLECYTHGKYLTDGNYADGAVSDQVGAIPLMLRIKQGAYLSTDELDDQSRKLGVLGRLKFVIGSAVTGIASLFTADNINTGLAWVNEARQFVEGHALWLLFGTGISIYMVSWLLQHYIYNDYSANRYQPSGGNDVTS